MSASSQGTPECHWSQSLLCPSHRPLQAEWLLVPRTLQDHPWHAGPWPTAHEARREAGSTGRTGAEPEQPWAAAVRTACTWAVAAGVTSPLGVPPVPPLTPAPHNAEDSPHAQGS